MTRDVQPVLEYDAMPGTPPAARVHWVVVASVVVNLFTLLMQSTNFLIYFLPRGTFRGLGTSLRRDSSTDWVMMSSVLVGIGTMIYAMIAGIIFLRTGRARQQMVIAHALLIVVHMISGPVEYLRRRQPFAWPEVMIYSVWMLAGFVATNAVPALVILIFARSRPSLSDKAR